MGAAVYGAIGIAAVDLLLMALFYPSRIDLITLPLSGYMAYLFVGAISPQLETIRRTNASPLLIGGALSTVRDVHLHMLPTILLLISAIAMKHRRPQQGGETAKPKAP